MEIKIDNIHFFMKKKKLFSMWLLSNKIKWCHVEGYGIPIA